MDKSITLYTDNDAYIYKPDSIDGYLLLIYNDLTRNIFYKFVNQKLDNSFKKVKEDKQKPLSLYNMFYKYIDNEQEIEVFELEEENLSEDECLAEENPLEKFFGYKYNEEEDYYTINSLKHFHIT